MCGGGVEDLLWTQAAALELTSVLCALQIVVKPLDLTVRREDVCESCCLGVNIAEKLRNTALPSNRRCAASFPCTLRRRRRDLNGQSGGDVSRVPIVFVSVRELRALLAAPVRTATCCVVVQSFFLQLSRAFQPCRVVVEGLSATKKYGLVVVSV